MTLRTITASLDLSPSSAPTPSGHSRPTLTGSRRCTSLTLRQRCVLLTMISFAQANQVADLIGLTCCVSHVSNALVVINAASRCAGVL